MTQALGPADDPAAVPHFQYEATYALDLATGLPLNAELTVYARLTDLYNNQYTLTLQLL